MGRGKGGADNPSYRHGHKPKGKPSPTYRSWKSMRTRVRTSPCYVGVTVCERWRDFANFLEDMGERPPGTTIDRIDGTKGYEPGNCRWANSVEQARNRKSTVLSLEQLQIISDRLARGERGVMLAKEFGVSTSRISQIRSRGFRRP